MAVIDASVLIDPFVGRDAERVKLAEDLLRLVEEEIEEGEGVDLEDLLRGLTDPRCLM